MMTVFYFFLLIFVRYLLVAGTAYLIVWKWGRRRFAPRKIQQRALRPHAIREELVASIVSTFFFALAGALVWNAFNAGGTRLYTDIGQYGFPYLFLSFVLLAFLHDTYFYWMYPLIHHPRLFRWVHQVHHRSVTPTPWAAFSFHPLEAILESAILPLLVFFIPTHVGVFLLLLISMTVLGVVNHLGYEFYFQGFDRHRFWKHFISARNHDEHHVRFNGNYGLYFTVWDRWMKTLL